MKRCFVLILMWLVFLSSNSAADTIEITSPDLLRNFQGPGSFGPGGDFIVVAANVNVEPTPGSLVYFASYDTGAGLEYYGLGLAWRSAIEGYAATRVAAARPYDPNYLNSWNIYAATYSADEGRWSQAAGPVATNDIIGVNRIPLAIISARRS